MPQESAVTTVADLPQGVRVSSEYPELTRRYFAEHGIDADIRLSHGATEAKVPDIVDCIVDGTETGRALRAAGLKIIGDVLTSYTALVANPAAVADPAKRHAMEQIKTLLDGVMEARGKVLVKLNVGPNDLDAVIALLPSMKSPTVSELFGDGGYAVETVVAKDTINTLIPALKDAGSQRHHRGPPGQDRPLMDGQVVAFDEPRGLGTIEADGRSFPVPLHGPARRDPSRRAWERR